MHRIILVVPIDGQALEKAMDTSRLVKKPVMVSRGGKTFQTMRWVRPGEAPASQRAKKPEELTAGRRGPAAPDHEAVKRLLDPATCKKIDKSKLVQPAGDVDTLYKMAEAVRGDFRSTMERLKDELGATELLSRPVLKSRERIEQKVKGDGAKDASQIYDIDGHTLVFDSIEGIAKALDHFMKDPNVIRIKNNYANPPPSGYRDINLNVRLSNGMISEVQLNTKAMIEAKEGVGHVFYEVMREALGALPPPPPPPPYEEVVEAQKKLYNFAWGESQRPSAADNLKASLFSIARPFWKMSANKLAGAGSNWLSDKTRNRFMAFGSHA